MDSPCAFSSTHLSAFVCDQGGERLGVEAAVAEAQAPVHTVSSQLQGLLTNVVLMETQMAIRLFACEDLI